MSLGPIITGSTLGLKLISRAYHGPAAWTICGWAKRMDTGSLAPLAGTRIWSKESGSLGKGLYLGFDDSIGNIRLVHKRSSSNLNYTTTNTPWADRNWKFVAVVCDTSGAANQLATFYFGSERSFATASSVGSKTDGGGTFDLAGVDTSMAFSMMPHNGSVSWITWQWAQFYNRALSVGELRSLQFNPRPLDNGCRLYLIMNDTGSCIEVSGYSGSLYNSGTISYGSPSIPPIWSDS